MGDFIGIHPLAMLLAFLCWSCFFFGSIGIFYFNSIISYCNKGGTHAGVHLPRNE